jgi:hypothetical protein
MTMAARSQLRQRAEYTHKYNLTSGRHGWLRLTPAYSVKVVEELISQCERPMRVFDPFCGTATTALCAAYHGHEGVTTDINPFLTWFGQVKTAHYKPTTISATADAASRALKLVKRGAIEPVPVPPLHNIERWWPPAALHFLRALRAAIDHTTSDRSAERKLLLVSFCRTLISLSNAAFNHQSMSFKHEHQMRLALDVDMAAMFSKDVSFVLEGASHNPKGAAHVILADSRNPERLGDRLFDRVITSPPYANRMSYIRELRPYMYWLGFLTNGRDAGELDWKAIGGTWGMATSRLLEWKPENGGPPSQTLREALKAIADHENKNGDLLSRYVAKYFDDIWAHLQKLPSILAPGAELHYIVGNSTFYGVLLPVEQIYAAMLRRLGFEKVECRPIRKRNSKKELIEFDVVATWPG